MRIKDDVFCQSLTAVQSGMIGEGDTVEIPVQRVRVTSHKVKGHGEWCFLFVCLIFFQFLAFGINGKCVYLYEMSICVCIYVLHICICVLYVGRDGYMHIYMYPHVSRIQTIN